MILLNFSDAKQQKHFEQLLKYKYDGCYDDKLMHGCFISCNVMNEKYKLIYKKESHFFIGPTFHRT